MEIRGQKFRGQGHFKVTEVSTVICLVRFQCAMPEVLMRSLNRLNVIGCEARKVFENLPYYFIFTLVVCFFLCFFFV